MNGEEIGSMLQRRNDSAVRATLLRAAGSDAQLQDLIDCSMLAASTGRADVAERLRPAIELHLGFSDAACAMTARIERQEMTSMPAAGRSPDVSTIDIALAELDRLAELHLDERASTVDADKRRPEFIAADSGTPLVAAAGALGAALGREHAVAGEIDAAYAACVDAAARMPRGTPAEYAGAELIEIADALLAQELRRFINLTTDQALPPFGSASLLYSVARFDRVALGPWIANIDNIVRHGRDVLGMVLRLVPEGDWSSRRRHAWLARLTPRLSDHFLFQAIEELADIGASDAVGALFAASARIGRLDGNYRCTQGFRDIALDLANWRVAIDAQRVIVAISHQEPGELAVLADIHATAGDLEEAGRLVERFATVRPDDPGARARMKALADGDYSAFIISDGFCSDPKRRAMRRHKAAMSSESLAA